MYNLYERLNYSASAGVAPSALYWALLIFASATSF